MGLTGVDAGLDVSVRDIVTANVVVGRFLTDVFLKFPTIYMPSER